MVTPISRLLCALLFLFTGLTARAAINAPSGLTGSWTPAQFTLSWTDNSNNESGFFVTYRVGTTGSFSIWDDVAANVKTFTVPNIPADGCLNVQWAVFGFAGPADGHTDLSPSSNIITLRSPPKIISPATYASPAGRPFSFYIRLQSCETATGFGATNLPAGLTVNSTTGQISGIPTAPAGNYTINLTATYGTPAKNVTGSVSVRLYDFVPRPAQAPAAQTIPAQTLIRSAAPSTFDLTQWFSDPDATSAVRVSTTLGNMDFGFFGNAAPLTVANFMNYVNRGDFTNSFFHRSVPGFVIQGGGFRATTPVSSVPTDPPVQNEFLPANSNLGGTISMAKLGGDPNSATCQFFVSLDNNAANLDNQNGGFTVFGRVAGSGMDTAFAIASQPVRSWTASPGNSALTDVPVSTHTAGDTYTAAQLVTVTGVAPIAPLTWQAVSSHPAVCTASVNGSTLTLSGLIPGTATITLTATDLDGLTVQQTMAITVGDNLTSWLAAQNFPTPADATAEADPDKDSIANIFEFAWLHDPQAPTIPQWPDLSTHTSGPEQRLALTFPVRKDTGSGFQYKVLAGPLTGPWDTVWSSAQGLAHTRVAAAVDHPGHTLVTITDSALITAGTPRYLRVEVSQQ